MEDEITKERSIGDKARESRDQNVANMEDRSIKERSIGDNSKGDRRMFLENVDEETKEYGDMYYYEEGRMYKRNSFLENKIECYIGPHHSIYKRLFKPLY